MIALCQFVCLWYYADFPVTHLLQQWVDLARFTGLQAQKDEDIPIDTQDSPNAALECNASEDTNIDEISKQ